MPSHTTCPPGRTASTLVRKPAGTPAASITTSAPRPAEDFPAMAQAYLDGRLDLDGLITARIAREQVNEGFAALKRGEAIRSVVMFA